MTIYFYVPAANVEAFKAAYAAKDIGEAVTDMAPNADRSAFFTGSSRCPPETAAALASENAWLEVTESPKEDWQPYVPEGL